jgi:hypothetical protein
MGLRAKVTAALNVYELVMLCTASAARQLLKGEAIGWASGQMRGVWLVLDVFN